MVRVDVLMQLEYVFYARDDMPGMVAIALQGAGEVSLCKQLGVKGVRRKVEAFRGGQATRAAKAHGPGGGKEEADAEEKARGTRKRGGQE